MAERLRGLLIAPPGAGKGTQATAISKEFGVEAISSGDLFRAEVEAGTPLGRQVAQYLDRGDLVPDELVHQLVREKVLEAIARTGGYLLDGFPRTLEQARVARASADELGITANAVVTFDVPRDVIVERMLQRARIEGRTDDDKKTILHRLDVYDSETAPVLDFYAALGVLIRIAADRPVEEVTAATIAALKEKLGSDGGAPKARASTRTRTRTARQGGAAGATGTTGTTGATGATRARAAKTASAAAGMAAPAKKNAGTSVVPVADVVVVAARDATSQGTVLRRRLAGWPERAVAAAVGLAATDALLLVGVLVTGLVASTRQGSAFARLGAAYVGAVGTAHGLLLVVAGALLAWASQTGAGGAQRAARVVLGLAVVFFIAAPFAAWGDTSYVHHSRQAVDGVVRAQLATWMAVTMLPAAVAGVIAWWTGSRPV
jgi:adenylate kinase